MPNEGTTTQSAAGLERDERIAHEITRLAFGHWSNYADGAGFALLLTILFSGAVPSIEGPSLAAALIWFAVQCLWSILALTLYRSYVRAPEHTSPLRWLWVRGAIALSNGAIWGGMLWALWAHGNAANQALLCVIVLAAMVSSFYHLAPSFPVLAASLLATAVTAEVRFLTGGDEIAFVFAIVLPLFTLLLLGYGRGAARKYRAMMEMWLSKEDIARELEKAKGLADAGSRSKSEFLANMSHELRTPLNAILGFSEVIRDGLLGAQGQARVQDYARHIHDSGTMLLSLVNDILDISKIEAGRMEISAQDVAADGLIASIRAIMGSKAQMNGLAFDAYSEPGLILHADLRAANQILFNLISNAIKFTKPGGEIRVSIHTEVHDAVIAVSDTGCGIPEALFPRLFDPFVQADNTYARAQGGTGLGLPIVRALARLHGGDCAVSSAVGRGTHVTVRLPQRRPMLAVADGSERAVPADLVSTAA